MPRLNIFPPVKEVFPNDRQIFTARSVAPPAMWHAVTDGGDIKSDFSLEVDAAGSTTTGSGAHVLKSGLGAIEATIDDQCRPTSSGRFTVSAFIFDVNNFQYVYKLNIDATAIEVRDEANNQIFTESYTTLSGDVYRIEMNAGFRLYRKNAGANDFILKHSRVGLATVVVYPMSYSCTILEPTAAAPTRIPAPRLIGDWQLSATANYAWTITHGSVTVSDDIVQTEYFGGITPGNHTLAVTIESAADPTGFQKAVATINIPALQVLGETNVTSQPGAKSRFKTNYDAAQTSLIAWSVLHGGGSFTQGEYTAPAIPGPAAVRAFADVNDQVADININIPVVITNANGYTAAKPSEEIDFNTNIPVMPTFVSVGGVGGGTGAASPGLPPGLLPGDLMLLVVETANETVSTPSGGWAVVADSPQGTGAAGGATSTLLAALWKRAGFNEPVPTVADPGDHIIAHIFAFRFVIGAGNPWDVTSGDTGASSTSVSIPGATTTVANTLVILAVANQTDTLTPQTSGYANADLTNLTERVDVNTDQGNGGGFAVITGEKAAAGAYGATTATLANASVQGRMSIALKPALITWSASTGSINSTTGTWTAPPLPGQTAKITASNGVFSLTIDVPVLEVFPFTDLALPIGRDRNLNALISTSEDRKKRTTRDKSPSHDSYEVKLVARTLADVQAVDAFFDSHGFGKMFILDDAARGIRKVGWFESAIRHESRDECDNDISFRFLEARL